MNTDGKRGEWLVVSRSAYGETDFFCAGDGKFLDGDRDVLWLVLEENHRCEIMGQSLDRLSLFLAKNLHFFSHVCIIDAFFDVISLRRFPRIKFHFYCHEYTLFKSSFLGSNANRGPEFEIGDSEEVGDKGKW